MKLFGDPFFWALVSMFGLTGAEALVGSARLAKFRSLGFASVGMFTIGRVVLVLPAVCQPRFGASDWSSGVGGVIFLAGMIFALPVFTIRPITGTEAGVSLRTGGFFRVVRNPLSFRCVVVFRLGADVPLGDRHRIGSSVVGGSVAVNDSRGGGPRAETRQTVPRVQATSPWTHHPGAPAMTQNDIPVDRIFLVPTSLIPSPSAPSCAGDSNNWHRPFGFKFHLYVSVRVRASIGWFVAKYHSFPA